MADHPFKVIEGTPGPDAPKKRASRAKKAAKPAAMIRCYRCDSTAILVMMLGMETRNGKVRGGQKSYVCATCFQRGQYVVVAY